MNWQEIKFNKLVGKKVNNKNLKKGKGGGDGTKKVLKMLQQNNRKLGKI